jgi:hypothetical protein
MSQECHTMSTSDHFPTDPVFVSFTQVVELDLSGAT